MRQADPGGLDSSPPGDQGSSDQAYGLDAGGHFALRELKVDKHACFPPGEQDQGRGEAGHGSEAAPDRGAAPYHEMRVVVITRKQ